VYTLPKLPYRFDALAPAISESSVRRHYEDNHAGYIRKTNELIRGSGLEGRDLLDVALLAKPGTPLANNAAQAWAHDFWWKSMTPRPVARPSWVRPAFDDVWVNRGAALFGAGWLWLVTDDRGHFEIVALPNADLPHRIGRPLLVMDLWEHAYYGQYGTKRADYLRNTLPLLNWTEVERRRRR
jgi:Fe-Mn family superoxide dismutase